MRELKFRIWDILKKEMVYGSFQLWFDHRGDIKNVVPIDSYPLIEIMQWTGLTDKHGKDIYESDIVTYHLYYNSEMYTGIVTYSNAQFLLNPATSLSSGMYLEVIGNVYEHTDLLQSTKEDA